MRCLTVTMLIVTLGTPLGARATTPFNQRWNKHWSDFVVRQGNVLFRESTLAQQNAHHERQIEDAHPQGRPRQAYLDITRAETLLELQLQGHAVDAEVVYGCRAALANHCRLALERIFHEETGRRPELATEFSVEGAREILNFTATHYDALGHENAVEGMGVVLSASAVEPWSLAQLRLERSRDMPETRLIQRRGIPRLESMSELLGLVQDHGIDEADASRAYDDADQGGQRALHTLADPKTLTPIDIVATALHDTFSAPEVRKRAASAILHQDLQAEDDSLEHLTSLIPREKYIQRMLNAPAFADMHLYLLLDTPAGEGNRIYDSMIDALVTRNPHRRSELIEIAIEVITEGLVPADAQAIAELIRARHTDIDTPSSPRVDAALIALHIGTDPTLHELEEQRTTLSGFPSLAGELAVEMLTDVGLDVRLEGDEERGFVLCSQPGEAALPAVIDRLGSELADGIRNGIRPRVNNQTIHQQGTHDPRVVAAAARSFELEGYLLTSLGVQEDRGTWTRFNLAETGKVAEETEAHRANELTKLALSTQIGATLDVYETDAPPGAIQLAGTALLEHGLTLLYVDSRTDRSLQEKLIFRVREADWRAARSLERDTEAVTGLLDAAVAQGRVYVDVENHEYMAEAIDAAFERFRQQHPQATRKNAANKRNPHTRIYWGEHQSAGRNKPRTKPAFPGGPSSTEPPSDKVASAATGDVTTRVPIEEAIRNLTARNMPQFEEAWLNPENPELLQAVLNSNLSNIEPTLALLQGLLDKVALFSHRKYPEFVRILHWNLDHMIIGNPPEEELIENDLLSILR